MPIEEQAEEKIQNAVQTIITGGAKLMLRIPKGVAMALLRSGMKLTKTGVRAAGEAVKNKIDSGEMSEKRLQKKKDGDLSIPLKRTQDILQHLGSHRRPGQVICGFSMETRDLLENSRKKLVKKHLDLIAANNLREEGAGFGTATNLLTLITAERETPLPLLSKDEAAHRLLDELLTLRSTRT